MRKSSSAASQSHLITKSCSRSIFGFYRSNLNCDVTLSRQRGSRHQSQNPSGIRRGVASESGAKPEDCSTSPHVLRYKKLLITSSVGAPGGETLPLDAIVGCARKQILELLDSTARPRDEDAVDAIARADAEGHGQLRLRQIARPAPDHARLRCRRRERCGRTRRSRRGSTWCRSAGTAGSGCPRR